MAIPVFHTFYQSFTKLKINTMKFLRVPVVALAALTIGISVNAQTVDDIVNKHTEALGGKDKLAGMKSISIEADLDIAGNQASSTTTILYGKGSLSSVDFGGQKIISSITTDKGGWSINPLAGQATAEPLPDDQLNAGKALLYPGSPLVNYAAKGNKVELAGQEDVNGVKAYKLKVTSKEGANLTFFVDPTTYYIVKSVTKLSVNGQDVEQAVNFSDYKKTDYGFVAPYTSARDLPNGMTINITVRKIEINKEVDPKIFDKP
jgi:outer membrane lipoprotein-sorting protein